VERLERFWGAMQGWFTSLFASELATAAAIDGHALGGGCMIALACDHRVMSRGTIGLNEAALGLPPPWWISDLLCRVVGEARGEQMLQSAATADANLALDLGITDAVMDSAISTTPEMPSIGGAEKRLEHLLRVPGRAGVKAERRAHFVGEMRSRLGADTDAFVAAITHPTMQAGLRRYTNSLKAKR
jgi:3,2-trans-enoyl-CoA isomerase